VVTSKQAAIKKNTNVLTMRINYFNFQKSMN
jgi:hypothetical protein